MIRMRPRTRKSFVAATVVAVALTVALIVNLSVPVHRGNDGGDVFARGVMDVAVEPGPLSFAVAGDDTTGLYWEVVRRFAADHGLQLRVKVVADIDEALALLRLGGCDMVAAGLPHTWVLRREFRLSRRLHTSHPLLVCNAGLRPQVTTPYDLGGRTVTLPAGSSYAVRLANLHSETGDTVKVRIEPKVTAYQLICRADADTAVMTVAGDRLVAMAADSCDNIAWFEIGFEQNVSFATAHGATALGDSLDTWLARMEEDAAYRRLCSGYLGGEVVR